MLTLISMALGYTLAATPYRDSRLAKVLAIICGIFGGPTA